MKKMSAICAGVLVSLSLLVSLPAFGGGGINVEGGPAIIKVFGAPVGIESIFKRGKCQVFYGVLPMTYSELAPGKTLRIKVIGDKDILVQCNGEKGITISRD